MSQEYLCKYCHSPEVKIEEVTFSNGTKHLRRDCLACGKFNNYAPHAPRPGENFGDYRIPIGQYKGKSLSSLPVDYLIWMSTSYARGSLKRKIDAYLEEVGSSVSGGEEEEDVTWIK